MTKPGFPQIDRAAHFVTSYGDGAYLLLHSDRRVDGLLLEGLIDDQPKSDLITKVVRGLLGHRKAGRWESTQENAFSFMGINDEGHSGIDEVKVKLYVQADADEAALREVWEHTLRTSPVGNTLLNVVKVTPELSVIP